MYGLSTARVDDDDADDEKDTEEEHDVLLVTEGRCRWRFRSSAVR